MVATIFAPEITTLESQVAQLQAQIAAAQSRIAALGEADAVASGALQALQDAVTKISGLAPSALATLKAAALNLFQGDDKQGDDEGNKPISPLPSPNGNGHNHKPEAVLGQDIVEISSQHLEKLVETIAPELNGQSCEINPEQYWDTAVPDGSAWEFASPYACLLEDVPNESLQGQSVEIACPVPEVPQEKPYIELVKLSDAVAYQRKHNGGISTAYVGFKSKTRAEAWGRWLVVQNNMAASFEVRAAKKMQGFKWEIKLWGIWDISFESIQRLTKLDFSGIPNDQALNTWFEAAKPSANVREQEEQKQAITAEVTKPGLVVITTRNKYHDKLHAYFIDGWQMPSDDWQPSTDEELMDKAAHREDAWDWKKNISVYKGRRVVRLELPKAVSV